jgi:hypothetical protein
VVAARARAPPRPLAVFWPPSNLSPTASCCVVLGAWCLDACSAERCPVANLSLYTLPDTSSHHPHGRPPFPRPAVLQDKSVHSTFRPSPSTLPREPRPKLLSDPPFFASTAPTFPANTHAHSPLRLDDFQRNGLVILAVHLCFRSLGTLQRPITAVCPQNNPLSHSRERQDSSDFSLTTIGRGTTTTTIPIGLHGLAQREFWDGERACSLCVRQVVTPGLFVSALRLGLGRN